MSEVVQRLPAPLVTGGQVAPIIPRSVEEMFRIAGAIHGSGLAPRTLDSKEKVLVAVMAGAELGLPPHQAVQAFYVVNNRPTLWGDAIPALLWANGFKLKEWFEGEGDDLTAHCEVTRPGGDVIPGEYSMADAKKAGLLTKDGPWKTATKRMLKMRARAFTARDGASDVLKGFQVREEVEDYQPVRDVAAKADIRGRLASATEHREGFSITHVAAETGIDPETGEFTDEVGQSATADPVTEAVDEANDEPADDFPGDNPPRSTAEASPPQGGGAGAPTLAERADAFLTRIKDAKTTIKMKAILAAADALRKELDAKDPELLADVDAAWNGRFAELEEAEAAERRGQ